MSDDAYGRDQVAMDREALEAVLGFSVDGEPWPVDPLAPGTRVRVLRDPEWGGPWQGEFTGVIDTTRAPHPVVSRTARPGELAYFVAFDSPQYDADGDGPYRKAEVWGRYLETL